MTRGVEIKQCRALTATTMREIVNNINNLEIRKEDIVSLFKDNGQFILTYFE